MPALKLAISPCPNDTFIFHALAQGIIDWPGGLEVMLKDVEELNRMAADGIPDVCKISVAAAAGILDEYALIRAGGAMGFGVGPVLVGSSEMKLTALDGKPVAIPGRNTTANLLFASLCHELGIAPKPVEMVFDEVMPAIAAGDVVAGVVIHEGRFTFKDQGMVMLKDLGQWWEEFTGLPIPLGCIAVRRSLGPEVAKAVNDAIRQSLEYARTHPQKSRDWIKSHAQEMDDLVIQQHIDMFVTDYSLDIGEQGEQAISALLKRAAEMKGVSLPPTIFW